VGFCRVWAWSSNVMPLCVHAEGQCPQRPLLPASVKLLRLVSAHISVWEPAIPMTRWVAGRPSSASGASGVTPGGPSDGSGVTLRRHVVTGVRCFLRWRWRRRL